MIFARRCRPSFATLYALLLVTGVRAAWDAYAGTPGVTLWNCCRVRPGMTYAQVEALLGPQDIPPSGLYNLDVEVNGKVGYYVNWTRGRSRLAPAAGVRVTFCKRDKTAIAKDWFSHPWLRHWLQQLRLDTGAASRHPFFEMPPIPLQWGRTPVGRP